MAQRMESAAPPGGVMLSESTARLVGECCAVGDPELVHIKGSEIRCRRDAPGDRRASAPGAATLLSSAVHGTQYGYCYSR